MADHKFLDFIVKQNPLPITFPCNLHCQVSVGTVLLKESLTMGDKEMYSYPGSGIPDPGLVE